MNADKHRCLNPDTGRYLAGFIRVYLWLSEFICDSASTFSLCASFNKNFGLNHDEYNFTAPGYFCL